LGVILTLLFIGLAFWAVLVMRVNNKEIVESSIGMVAEVRTLGSLLISIMVALIGGLLPIVSRLITNLEGRMPSGVARSNVYRFFIGKVALQSIFAFFVFEVFYGQPIYGDDLIVELDCELFECKEDQAAIEFYRLLLVELIRKLLSPLARVLVKLCSHGFQKVRGKDAGHFTFPEFDIAVIAVDTIYLFMLLSMVALLVPFFAIVAPFIMYLSFQWLKLCLKRLCSRPFVAESKGLSVALQRCVCVAALFVSLLAGVRLIMTIPSEPTCGPVDGWQPAGMVLLQIDILGFRNVLRSAADLLYRGFTFWLLATLSLVFLLYLLKEVSRKTNYVVMEQMTNLADRQVASLTREMWRLERQQDLLKKRLEWLQDKAATDD